MFVLLRRKHLFLSPRSRVRGSIYHPTSISTCVGIMSSSYKLLCLENPLLGTRQFYLCEVTLLIETARHPSERVRVNHRDGLCRSVLIALHRNHDLLKKYGLKANDAILAEEKHMPLFEDLLKNYEAKLLAGGAAQNTARGAQVGAR